MAKKQRAALICRVSTPHQIKLGLESQVACLKKRATEDGYEVPEELIFQEQISGLDAKKPIRKSLQDLMNAVEEHKVDVAYTYELTRISRDPYNLIDRVKWFSDRKIPMYIYDAELWTLDTKSKEEIEETTEYVFGAATYGKVEANKMKLRTTRARNEIAKQGLYVGHLSDGYCVVQTERGKEIKRDDDRVGVIHQIFDLYTQGYTIDRIAEKLNASKVPTANSYRLNSPKFKGYQETYHRKGSNVPINREDIKWQGSTISNYLRNEWYVGVRRYNKLPHNIDPIIDSEQWSIVSAMLKENAANFRSKKERSKHNYLLSGLVYCGKCGKRMYGHYTGLNNHYYCSSIEEGIKCGLRGVCKENLEAAVTLTVRKKGYMEAMGERDKQTIGNFFKNPLNDKKLKEEIKTNKVQIKEYEKELEKLDLDYTNAIKLRVQFASNQQRASQYEKVINEIEENIASVRLKLLRLNQRNIQNTKRLNIKSNVEQILVKVLAEKNPDTLKELFHTVIEKILIYNLTPSSDVVRVKFIDGETTDFIYSFGLLKNNILFVSDCYRFYGLFHYDAKNNVIKCNNAPLVLIKDGNRMPLDAFMKKPVEEIKQYYGKEGVGYFVIKDKILPSKEFIKFCMGCDEGVVEPFERLEELSDEAKAQNAKYKEWRKKYNTGLPSCVPYVVKDETYKDISVKRKHLYNRKNKIKMHKRLTDEEKQEKMAAIDEELALLKAKLKYLNRVEAVKEYKKNQKEELEKLASEPLD